MGFFSMASDLYDLLSGANLDEEAQNIVDEVREKANEQNLTSQGSTLPTNDVAPLEEVEEIDYDYGDFDESEEDDTPLPEDEIPIVNPQDSICTNNPDDTSCEQEIIDAYFAHKAQKSVPSTEVGSYTFNNPYRLLKDNTAGRENVVDDILEWLVKRKLGSTYVNETTKANIDTSLPYEKLGKGVPITFDVYNSDTQETTSHSTIIKNSAGKYDGREKIPTKKRASVVNYIVKNVKTPSDGNKYITTKKDVEEALTKTEYAAGEVVENIKLYKVIDDYKKITKANLGSKIYLVAKTKNFRNGASVKFKIFENGDKLLSDYVDEEERLPFLQGTTQKVETVQSIKTEDVDNPETGNVLEGQAAVEIALRPKKDKPDNEEDSSINFEAWKKKFKKEEGETEDKGDKLYLKVSSTSYPEIEEKEFLVGDELVLRNSKCSITVELIEKVTGKKSAWFSHKNMKEYTETYKVDKEKFTEVLNKTLAKYQIETCHQKAHFLSQVFHESDHFRTLQEYASGLDYDVATHKEGYKRYKNNPELYKEYKKHKKYKPKKYKKYKNSKNKEELLAYQKHIKYHKYLKDRRHYNRYLECIKMNNKKAGDGAKYKGKGLIQLTWKSNYEAYKKASSLDVVNSPTLLASTIEGSIDASCWYWRNKGTLYKKYSAKGDINILIENDKNNVTLITLAVNGGSRGLKGRKKIFKALKKEWSF